MHACRKLKSLPGSLRRRWVSYKITRTKENEIQNYTALVPINYNRTKSHQQQTIGTEKLQILGFREESKEGSRVQREDRALYLDDSPR